MQILEMNYKELLEKYIRHVSECEGVDFIFGYRQSCLFTDIEWDELKRLIVGIVDEDNLIMETRGG